MIRFGSTHSWLPLLFLGCGKAEHCDKGCVIRHVQPVTLEMMFSTKLTLKKHTIKLQKNKKKSTKQTHKNTLKF